MARKPRTIAPEERARLDAIEPWTPPALHRESGPACPWPHESGYWRRLPAYVRPSQRAGLHRPIEGPQDMPDEAVKAYIAEDPFVRGGLRWETARAMAYIEQFKPRSRA